MKKLLPVLLFSCAFIITAITTQAQPNTQADITPALSIENAYAPATSVNAMAAYRNINIRAVRSFKTMYKNIDNEAWLVIPDGYRATFSDNGIAYIVTYNQKGGWQRTLRQYYETKMDHDIRALVKSIYYDYNITLVEEIERPSKPIEYVVHMEDKVSMKNISICNGEMRTVLDANKL